MVGVQLAQEMILHLLVWQVVAAEVPYPELSEEGFCDLEVPEEWEYCVEEWKARVV